LNQGNYPLSSMTFSIWELRPNCEEASANAVLRAINHKTRNAPLRNEENQSVQGCLARLRRGGQ